MNIWESDLPGIGRKFQMETRNGDKLIIVIHDNGRREIYHLDQSNPDECVSTITLDDEEAMKIAGIIGGMNYKPKALENIEITLNDLVIEWHKVEPQAACIGKTIGQLAVRQKTGATIIAVIEAGHYKKINPGPDQILAGGSTLIVVGERQHVKAFKQLLASGE
ncbi:cation:proton antiporter regulatory subunit [Brevibacillus sp. B_LB10_24]|uniref:cation:proton antiporter regulatory subunit n=1 Tax=Brevibacillus sp. B_LB10_24 TaxID=3380645 RepID=UPI0038B7B7EA